MVKTLSSGCKQNWVWILDLLLSPQEREIAWLSFKSHAEKIRTETTITSETPWEEEMS